jgi:hypothetical protein
MGAVAWNLVKDKLVSALPAIVGSQVVVFDGPIVSGENPPVALVVGATPSVEGITAGRFVQDRPPDGYRATESGSVSCELSGISGLPSIPDVFDTFALLAAWIQADQTLGGTLSTGSTCFTSADVIEANTSSGGVQRLIITVTYRTDII